MNKKTNLIGGAILIAVIMFVAGYEISSMQNSNTKAGVGNSGNYTSGANRSGQNGARRGGGFSGGVSGTILSIDNQGFTINNASSGSAIILTGSSTRMEKTVEVTKDQFKVGDAVTIMGQKNSDGSYTAQNIMLGGGNFGARPNTASSTPTK